MKKNVEGESEVKAVSVPAAEHLEIGDVVMLAVETLAPSKTNPRKDFLESGMKDLMASIKDKGIIQPLIVRKTNMRGGPAKQPFDVYEIVCGERRYRAAKALELAQIPCMVCDMTDQQVIEVQIVENLQRADLTPIEEAKSYEQLHEQYKYDWPELAARVGKSQQYVFTRLNLLKLIPGFQKMLSKGELKLSYAEAITQITDPKQQEELLNDITGYMCMPETVEDLKEQIRDKFLLQLVNAPFPVKDKDLQGGACGSCLTRTGAKPDLFGDLQGKNDTCQNPKCWADKKKEYEKKALAKYADLVKAGHKVLIGAAAEKAISGGQYERETDSHYYLKNKTTWAEALKGTEYKPVIAIDGKGKKHELISARTAIAFVPDKLKHSDSVPDKPKTAEENALENIKIEAENAAREELTEKMEKLAGKLDFNEMDVLEALFEGVSYGAHPKDKTALKWVIIREAFNNQTYEEIFKFFGLEKELKELTKQKLAELKAANPEKKGEKK